MIRSTYFDVLFTGANGGVVTCDVAWNEILEEKLSASTDLISTIRDGCCVATDFSCLCSQVNSTYSFTDKNLMEWNDELTCSSVINDAIDYSPTAVNGTCTSVKDSLFYYIENSESIYVSIYDIANKYNNPWPGGPGVNYSLRGSHGVNYPTILPLLV